VYKKYGMKWAKDGKFFRRKARIKAAFELAGIPCVRLAEGR